MFRGGGGAYGVANITGGTITGVTGITCTGDILCGSGSVFGINGMAKISAAADGPFSMTKWSTASRADLNVGNLLDGNTKTLTESSATGVADIAIASNSRISGQLFYSIEADDGTDFQVRTGQIPFTAVNKAGTITANVGTAVETVSISTGTLTVTITIPTGASKVTLSANAVSSLTQTTLRCLWKIVSTTALTVTAL